MFQMRALLLQSLSMNDDLLRFTLSHCVDQVERLELESCGITNEIVEQLAKKIKMRQKPVINYTELF